MNDGSNEVAASAFNGLVEKYRDRGWSFLTRENSFVDAARNRAAASSTADYLLFVDADDIVAPNTLESMLPAITFSGNDCLVAGGLLFDSDDPPCDFETGKLSAPILATYMPLGPGPAMNAGAAVAQGEFFVLLNSDTLVTDGWLMTVLYEFDDRRFRSADEPVTDRANNPCSGAKRQVKEGPSRRSTIRPKLPEHVLRYARLVVPSFDLGTLDISLQFWFENLAGFEDFFHRLAGELRTCPKTRCISARVDERRRCGSWFRPIRGSVRSS